MSDFVGVPRLGYQDSSAYGEFVLGDEYSVLDVEQDSSYEYLLTQSERRVNVRYVKNTSGATLVPGTVVKRDVAGDVAHDVVAAGDNEVGCGIVDPRIIGSVEVDAKFLIIVKGPIDVVAGGAAPAGGAAGVGAAGEVVTAANTDVDAFGLFLEAPAAQGDVVRCDVDFRAVGN